MSVSRNDLYQKVARDPENPQSTSGDLQVMTARNAVEHFARDPLSCNRQVWCFSHAGAGPSEFRRWPELVNSEAIVCGIRLPGRESRLGEVPFTEVSEAVSEILQNIGDKVSPDAVFYGQCFGAIIAFEVAAQLATAGANVPTRLYLASQVAPGILTQQAIRDGQTEQMTSTEFKRMVVDLEYLTVDIAQNEEVWHVIEPALRADFQMVENYRMNALTKLLSGSIVALVGTEDYQVEIGEVSPWSDLTAGSFQIRELSGEHLLSRSSGKEICDLILADWNGISI
jgi:surfactin synthase thioesterase subunit